jgi:dTMP kinase
VPTLSTRGVVRIDEQSTGGATGEARPEDGPGASATHRIRSVLAIRPFRRLWAVTAVASFGDWLSLLALTALATQLTTGYQAQSFALGGVVATKLLPALFMAPLGGVLADKFDRRTVMVTCDVLKALLFLSIPLVGSLWWLFAATFLIELCALCWIPAKDSSVPNLLKRKDQIETANQLSLVMTYGVAVISAAGAFALISKAGNLGIWSPTPTETVYFALCVNGFAALLTAFTVALRIPEISGRSAERRQAAPGLLAMLRDGAQFVTTTPLVRGLVLGIIGAFAAGGAVIASARLYAASLGGGEAAYSTLFIAMFTGIALGMAFVPRVARRMPHHRLFGVAIVGAGTSLLLVAVAWHLYLALLSVMLVGLFAGTALLTGLTIIGAQVEDAVRGRVVAFVQSIVRVDLLASMSVVPLLVGLVQSRTLTLFGQPAQVDGTRFVLAGAGVVAAAVGVLAYRQMDDRRDRTILADVKRALRRRRHGEPGLLVAVEGASRTDTAEQSDRLVRWLADRGADVVLAGRSASHTARVSAAVGASGVAGQRAQALVAAAVRADVLTHEVLPALRAGHVVVIESLDSPLARVGDELDAADLQRLGAWATGSLRPDITVLLDRDPRVHDAAPVTGGIVDTWQVQRTLTEMAAADPGRYVRVEADGDPADVAARVRELLAPLVARAIPRAEKARSTSS